MNMKSSSQKLWQTFSTQNVDIFFFDEPVETGSVHHGDTSIGKVDKAKLSQSLTQASHQLEGQVSLISLLSKQPADQESLFCISQMQKVLQKKSLFDIVLFSA